MQFGRHGFQEDAEALADAQTDGEDEETAPNGGPIGTGGHLGNLLSREGADKAFALGLSNELLHAVTSHDVAQIVHGSTVLARRLGSIPVHFGRKRPCRASLERERCTFKPPRGDRVECFVLIVPENREQPEGREVRLKVAGAEGQAHRWRRARWSISPAALAMRR
jgi:hypothetical protein